MRAARRDANEDYLLRVAEQLGGFWVYAGPLDGWILHRGKWTPVEIKAPKGLLTQLQQRFMRDCETYGGPRYIWRTDEDVIKDLGGEWPRKYVLT